VYEILFRLIQIRLFYSLMSWGLLFSRHSVVTLHKTSFFSYPWSSKPRRR